MLIDFSKIKDILIEKNIVPTGAFHIGAHDCEELPFYYKLGLTKHDILWIDALPSKAANAKEKGIPNVYTAIITDKDDEIVTFNVSNNGQSSSILEFGTHSAENPWCVYIDRFDQPSITIDTFFERNGLDASKYNIWNLDIQGAEFLALQGAKQSIQYVELIYLEVNEKELYKNCGMIDQIDSFLSNYKFKRVHTVMTGQGWGDALYVKHID